MAILNISGTINSSFGISGVLNNAAQGSGDAIFTIDLRPTTPIIIVQDNLNYGLMGWDINDVAATIILSGPQGAIYINEDFNDPDIVPATSRYLNKIITLPLDPLTGYQNILKGNYTLKVSWYNSVLDEYWNFQFTYNYTLVPPTIANRTVSGPYSGILTSDDITEYGNNVHQIIREHRIQYPTQLATPPADIVSSNAQIQVTPIYTNNWNIIISSFVEYRQPDTLRIYWEGSGEFTHCVFGGCIGSMYDAINTMLLEYKDALACNTGNQEAYQKRLVIINTAWHLLNEAYWNGDTDEADAQSYVIQEQVEYTGGGICGGTTSALVTPCPPWTGGGVGGTYTFENGLTESLGVVELGGVLVKDTTILQAGYSVTYSGSNLGDSFSVVMSAAAGIEAKNSDGINEGSLLVDKNAVKVGVADIGTPANDRKYTFGIGGLVEDADYSAGYVPLSLVNKQYVDSLAGTTYTFQNGLNEAGGVVELSGEVINDVGLYGDENQSFDVEFYDSLYDEYGWFQVRPGGYMLYHENIITGYAVSVDGGYSPTTADHRVSVNSPSGELRLLLHTTSGIIITDTIYTRGAAYAADYSVNFTDHSLVTKKWVEDNFASEPVAVTFLDLTDVPNDYTGFTGYLVRVNTGATGLEFFTGTWVPVTGGAFTGAISVSSTATRPITSIAVNAGGTPGTPESGTNLISFQDNDGDEQGSIGIDASGNLAISTYVSGQLVLVSNNLNVLGNITLTGLVDGVNIADFKAAYDIHTHTFASITGKPTTLLGYGITDAMLKTANSWTTEFSSKAVAVSADYLVIEDSADGRAKKYVTIANLPTVSADFLSLTDTPSIYTGQGGYFVRVNSGATGLEFTDLSGLYISTTAGTLNAITEKSSPISADIILIEDSAAGYVQRKVLISSLPTAGTSGGAVALEFRYSTTITDTDPGAGRFQLDSLTMASVTFINVDYENWNNVNVQDIFNLLKSGDIIYIQQLSDASRSVMFEISGTITDETGYLQIPVTYLEDSGGVLEDSNDCGLLVTQQVTVFSFPSSVVESAGAISLSGDVVSPGADYFYGTNGSGTKGWYVLPSAVALHASTHHVSGTDLVNHDLLTGFVSEEHIRWDQTGIEDIHVDRITSTAITQHIGDIDHDQTLNYVAAEHIAYTFQNGITLGGSTVSLGGSLLGATSITAGSNVFTIQQNVNSTVNAKFVMGGTGCGLQGFGTGPVDYAYFNVFNTGLLRIGRAISGVDKSVQFNDAGLYLTSDYSADFSDLNYVNKKWVEDNFVSTVNSGSGITVDVSNNVNLGGALNAAAIITSTFYQLRFDADDFGLSSRLSAQNEDISISTYNSAGFSGNKDYLQLFRGTSARIGWQTGSTVRELSLGATAIVVTDTVSSKGVVYAGDYSANWTDHSLVTKSWVEDNFPIIPPPETVARTIYVETTGSDITGDGSVGNPFLTPKGALDSIGRIFGVEITVELGIGTFDWDSDTKLSLNDREITSGGIIIKGQYSVVHAGAVITETANAMIYDVVLTGTFAADELKGLWVNWHIANRFGTITWNSAGTNSFQLEMTRRDKSGTWDIVQLDTVLNLVDPEGLDISLYNDVGGYVGFQKVDIELAVATNNLDILYAKTNTYFQDTKMNVGRGIRLALSTFGRYGRINLDRVNLIGSGAAGSRLLTTPEFSGVASLNRVFFDRTNHNITDARACVRAGSDLPLITIQECVFRGVVGGKDTAFDGGGYNINLVGPNNFRDLVGVINLENETPKSISPVAISEEEPFIQLFNTPYLFVSTQVSDGAVFDEIVDNFSNSMIVQYDGNYLSMFRNRPTAYIIPDRNCTIVLDIPEGYYPEIDVDNKVSGIVVNATTSLDIGIADYNKSIKINYVLQRGTESREGIFEVLNVDDTNVLVTDNYQETSSFGVSLNSVIVGGYIQLQVIVDNSSVDTVDLNFNTNRVMK